MAVRLFKLINHQNRTAVSEVEGFVVDGAFLLDFSHPLEIHRWFGVPNRWFWFCRQSICSGDP